MQPVSSEPQQSASADAVLLINLGTPAAPTPQALHDYLREFLWDPRVVDFPRIPWWLILNGFILRFRPSRSAKLYEKVWTDQGSPLMVISRAQQQALQRYLEGQLEQAPVVELAMRYGQPSVASVLEKLKASGAQRIIVLPLYPQYSSATTASSFDAIAETFKCWRHVPTLRMISDYHLDSAYIGALAASVRECWQQYGQAQRLLISFHGCPKRFCDDGDPYYVQCTKTAAAIAQQLQLNDDGWSLVFQSRFGKEEWLKPYLDETLPQLVQQGVKSVQVICPGFSADCLETLEEIALGGRKQFLQAGGEQYHYIPALNERADHIAALGNLLIKELS
ncbi:MAG: ferrochelatase [Gammaproteobacteria bacterium]|nr:ferrochelatase [Gammaproteobacteria bacterium]